MADASTAEPVSLSCLLDLPSKGFFDPAGQGVFCSASSLGTYVPTHAATQPPASRIISTDHSTEAWIRLLKRRVPAPGSSAAAGPSQAKSTAATKRTKEQGEGAPAQKKAKADLASLLSPGGAVATGPSKQDSKAKQPAAGTSKPQDNGAGPSSSKPALKPSTTSPFFPSNTPAAALAASVQAHNNAKTVYEQDQLKGMPVKDLKEVCKSRSLPVSGTKEQLVTRIVEYQRRVKRTQ